MEAAKDGMGDNLAAVWERLGRARDGLRDALVGSGQVEVVDVLLDDVVKVALTQDQIEVEALASEAAEEAFADGIGLGGAVGGAQYQDASACGDSSEGGAELAVVVVEEEAGSLAERGGFSELLCGPGIGGVSGDGEVDDTP